jgi:hypothetical protein
MPSFISNSVNKNNGDQIYIVSLGIESHLLHTLESGHLTIAIEVPRYDLYPSFCLNLPRLNFDWASPLGDRETLDEIFISSPCFGSRDRVRISSGAAWYLIILTSFGPVCHEIYSGGTPLDPK